MQSIQEEEEKAFDMDETAMSGRDNSFNYMEQSFDVFAVQDNYLKKGYSNGQQLKKKFSAVTSQRGESRFSMNDNISSNGENNNNNFNNRPSYIERPSYNDQNNIN